MIRLLFLLLMLPLAIQPLAAQTQTHRADRIAVGGSGMGGAPVGPYTLFSLTENRVVANADSASTAWDLAFIGTTVLINGGTSGPGSGAAALIDTEFDALTIAPEAALVADGDGDCGTPQSPAICPGSGNGWYTYGGNGVSPIPGKTLVVRLADGSRLAKVRFISYELSAPLADGSRPRYYTFEHARLDP